jgi:mRNA interferase MazF
MTATVNTIIRRGDIWMADLRIGTIGSEQGEIRPVVVVQNNIGNKFSPTVTIVPLTSRIKNNLPTHVEISDSCLTALSIALVEQIRTIDKSRLIRHIGRISKSIMNQINEAIAIQVGLKDVAII